MDITPEQAVTLLKEGQVVALPTETVYGLAASIHHEEAINRIFTLKGRPQDNPLIIHVASLDQLNQFHPILPKDFEPLTKAFWPGLLTLVLPIDIATVQPIIRADLPTVAFRMPAHPLAREIIAATGPLVMPSANRSGKPSATRRAHVETDFGSSLPVLDGGVCHSGIESTILIYRENKWQIIREGALEREAIEHVVPVTFAGKSNSEKPLCPGQKYRHYAPNARLTPVEVIPENYAGAIVGYTDRIYPTKATLYYLGDAINPSELGVNLYATLRRLDDEGITDALVDINLPDQGLFHTLRERLLKACIPYR